MSLLFEADELPPLGEGGKGVGGQELPPPSAARVEENQAGLDESELLNGQGVLILYPSKPAIAPTGVQLVE